jgi:hypothetical protein
MQFYCWMMAIFSKTIFISPHPGGMENCLRHFWFQYIDSCDSKIQNLLGAENRRWYRGLCKAVSFQIRVSILAPKKKADYAGLKESAFSDHINHLSIKAKEDIAID